MGWIHNSLRTRLLVTYLLLILVGFGGLTLFAGNQAEKSTYANAANTLREQAAQIAAALPNALEDDGIGNLSPKTLAAGVRQITQKPEIEVAILDSRGIVQLAGPSSVLGSDQGAMPEVTIAQGGGAGHHIRTNSQGRETLFAAAPIVYENSTLAYVQLAEPTAKVRAEVQRSWLQLGGVLAIFSIAGVIVSLWLSSTLIRPLADLRQGALKMAEGDLAQRVANGREDEIGAVSHAFNQMAEQVEAMLAEQRAFASNASHELRTPLTTIRLRTEALQSGTLNREAAAQYIAQIDQEARRLTDLVEDLILLSRLDAERLAIGDAEIDVQRLTQSIQRELQPELTHKAIRLGIETPQGPPSPVQGNLNHLHVVFRNLLENAVKYTPAEGQVTISLAQRDGLLQWQITDSGQGIAPEDLPHVQSRFYRADKARARQTEGVGLGLALVQSIVTLYHGRMEVQSAGVNQGTTVTVWWPMRQRDI